MRRAMPISVLSLTLMFTAARALPQQSTPTGVIEGIVVRADTGAPITGAQVTLTAIPVGQRGVAITVVGPAAINGTAQGPGNFQPVTTGSDGKFSFRNLNPGTYRVTATANGFVRQEYGQRALNGTGRPVPLSAGETFRDAVLRLTPTGTITGRVFDENGQPATGAPVQLVRATYNVNGRTLQTTGTGLADDRGEYRIYGITPGRYYLVAGTPPGPLRVVTPGLGGPAGTARFAMVYYPSASIVDQALMIEVRSGTEANFDFRLQRQTQTYSIRGRVINATGAPLLPNTNISLAFRSFGGGGSFGVPRSFDAATGVFELRNVPPGDFTVRVQILDQNPLPPTGPVIATTLAERQAALASRLSAEAAVHVVDSDIEGVVLNLTSGVSVPGRIVVEGRPLTALQNLQLMALMFQPSDTEPPGAPNPVGLPPAADGTFQVLGLREAEYRVGLRGNPPPASGLYVKGIEYGGEDLLNKPFRFSGTGSGTFVVTLRSGAGQVSGTVTNALSQPLTGVQVFAIPTQRERRTQYRTAVSDQNGHYTLSGLTPGDYQLFSWEALDNLAQYDPEFLKPYEQQGKAVHVAESSNQNVDLKVIPAQ